MEIMVKCGLTYTSFGIYIARRDVLEVLKGSKNDLECQTKETLPDADLLRASYLARQDSRCLLAERLRLLKTS